MTMLWNRSKVQVTRSGWTRAEAIGANCRRSRIQYQLGSGHGSKRRRAEQMQLWASGSVDKAGAKTVDGGL